MLFSWTLLARSLMTFTNPMLLNLAGRPQVSAAAGTYRGRGAFESERTRFHTGHGAHKAATAAMQGGRRMKAQEIEGDSGRKYKIGGILQDRRNPFGHVYLARSVGTTTEPVHMLTVI